MIGVCCKVLFMCIYDFYGRCVGFESSILSVDLNVSFQSEWLYFQLVDSEVIWKDEEIGIFIRVLDVRCVVVYNYWLFGFVWYYQ